VFTWLQRRFHLAHYGNIPLYGAVFLCVLVHFSGAIGMIFFDRDLFVAFTPINLLLMFMLLVWNEQGITQSWLLGFAVALLTGIGSEMIGVHTGLLFGSYIYGDVLGIKIMGVPLLIGFNWFCIVYCAFISVGLFFRKRQMGGMGIALFSGWLATCFDWIMEPVAMELGFWQWEGNAIPLFNYICWWILASALAYVFHRLRFKSQNQFAPILLLVQAIFFIALRIFI
jgi:bisanhydrobacterioruberin hydratase